MMAHNFVTEMKTGMTLQIDLAGVVPGLSNGAGVVSLTLLHKKGRSARFEVVADARVSIDKYTQHGVKLAGEQ